MNKFKGECEITIGGKSRPMVFNMHSYAIASEGMMLSIDDYQKAMNDHRQARAFMWLVYAALSTALEMRSKIVDFTYFDVADWLVEVDDSEIKKISDTIEATTSTNLPKQKGEVSDKKK